MASSSVPSPLITPTPALPPASSPFPLPWRERDRERGLFPWCFLCFLSPRHLLRSLSPGGRGTGRGGSSPGVFFVPSPLAGEGQGEGGGQLSFERFEAPPALLIDGQIFAQELADHGFRQLAAEFDLAGHLIFDQPGPAKFNNLLGGGLHPVF